MPAVAIFPADLSPFADIETRKAEELIKDAIALAKLVAPCIVKDDFADADAAKAILRGAILRWNDAGSGAITTDTDNAGPFGHSTSVDTRLARRNLFFPSEIDQLRKLCSDSGKSGAWSYDTVPARPAYRHALWCDATFGRMSCSCGSDINGGIPFP